MNSDKKKSIFYINYHNRKGYKEEYLKKYNAPKKCELCDVYISGLSFNRHLKTKKHKLNETLYELIKNNKMETIKKNPFFNELIGKTGLDKIINEIKQKVNCD